MKTLIIDNYDSFTYNLFQYVAELEGKPVVFKNDKLDLAKIKELGPSHIIISPGPGTVTNKNDFGICEEVILKLGPTIPILGVCLGHQGIAHAFGGKIEHAPQIMHGKTSLIEYARDANGQAAEHVRDAVEPAHPGIFQNIPNPFIAMRYHSLIVSTQNFPPDLKITAWTKEKLIMGIQHRKFPIFGIQFHPESFGTAAGKDILKNFLNLTS
jgi:anthranilate synthase component 2